MGPLFVAHIPTPISCNVNSIKTTLQIKAAATNGWTRVVAFWISFDDPTLGVRTKLVRQAAGGTSSAVTVYPWAPSYATARTTSVSNFSSEPSYMNLMWEQYVLGYAHIQFALDDELVLSPDERVGLVVYTSMSQAPNATAGFLFRES